MQIGKNKVVTIEYTLKNDDGEVIDSSVGGEPLAYIHNSGHIIAGLESALDGKTAGDSLSVRIAPEDAYGLRNVALTQVLPRSAFEGVDSLEVGMQFHGADAEGNTQLVTITAIEGDDITIDGNHPLADQHLNFDVEVKDVRDATAEELDHGHVHGPGGHHH